MIATHLTVVGNLTTSVETHRLADGTALAKFGVASTERRYDGAAGGWVDGETLFVDVRCRRDLAQNASASLVKGDAVVVTGRLYTRMYEHEGRRRSAVTLEAHSVAPDLTWCTAVVTRTRRRAGATPTASSATGAERREAVEAAQVITPSGSDNVADDARGLVGAVPGGEGR